MSHPTGGSASRSLSRRADTRGALGTVHRGARRCLALLLLCTAAAAQPTVESQRFARFLDETHERHLAHHPQLATGIGRREGLDRWDDMSESALAAEAERARENIRRADAQFDYARLDPAMQLQHRVFVDEQRLLLERYRWRNHLYALNQIVGLHIDVPGVLSNQQPLENAADAALYIRRIRAVRPAFEQLMRRMRIQETTGVFMPKSVYPLLIEAARNVITGAPHAGVGESPIYADFSRRLNLLALDEAAKHRFLEQARRALLADLEPSYRRLIDLLRSQSQRTPIDGGVWQLPQGDEFYAFLIRQFTTTSMTPLQVHEMGLREVQKAQEEIGALMRRVGFEGSVREFMARTKADPRHYLSNDETGRAQYLQRARSAMSTMQDAITRTFESPPPLPLQIRRTETYKEASSPQGFYEAGSADGRRPGTIYLNLSDMRVMPLYEMEDLLYHEGIPGHHLQISTITVDQSIPASRKVNEWWQDSAFVEGWGLYAERLAKDMGFYQDPYAEFGLLAGELWRASRLVVDSGLHYKRWTRAEAIRYLNENTPSAEETNVRAVDRYLAVPGQATSFMVGMRKFVSERERARQALGSRFDIRTFHRIALGSGYVPLWALEQNVSAWIASTAPAPTADAAFDRLLEDYWQAYLQLHPQFGLSTGDRRFATQFDASLQDDWRERMLAMLAHYSAAVAAVSPAGLSTQQRTSLVLLRGQLADAQAFYSSDAFITERRLPIDHFQGPHLAFAADAAGAGVSPFNTVADYEAAMLRADGFARWVDMAIQRLREGMAGGVTLPRLVVSKILPQLEPHLSGAPEKTEFWHPLENLPADISGAQANRIKAAYRREIATVIQPAYRRLHAFLLGEYLPHARSSSGLGAIPGGEALYAHDIRFHTTTSLTAQQIHELGIAEVDRIEAEFSALQRRLGIAGDLPQFYSHVRQDPALKFSSREQIVPAFDAARRRILTKLPLLFDALPRAAFEIKALPESFRQSQGNGYYSAASADGSRPGILWINTFAPGVSDTFNVMTISLHEGLPGHHLQTSIAQERGDLPAFRRFDSTTAYQEGWALYSESLGIELGVFDDPWSYVGHLNQAILRADRLVIDTGIHAMGWDVERGVQWMLKHSSMTEPQARAEVERYVAYPGQALAYKIGELKIRALRSEAAAALGPRFDIRGFHDQVLFGGSMPLNVLEQTVREWINQFSQTQVPGAHK